MGPLYPQGSDRTIRSRSNGAGVHSPQKMSQHAGIYTIHSLSLADGATQYQGVATRCSHHARGKTQASLPYPLLAGGITVAEDMAGQVGYSDPTF